jgi:L-asparaginase
VGSSYFLVVYQGTIPEGPIPNTYSLKGSWYFMRTCLIFFILLFILPFTVSAPDTGDNDLPHVVILATGGTIAGTASSATELVNYTAGNISVDQLITSVPGLSTYASMSGEQFCNIPSDEMTPAIWLNLSRRVNELLADPAVDGVVITHGTDTLEETAYFMNLVVQSEKPVVITGSMRPATAISADGPLNLMNAVRLAGDPDAKGRGVLICLNNEINGARDTQKTMTEMVETFRSPDFGLLGYIQDGKPVFYRESTRRHTSASEFNLTGITRLPRVDIVYAYAGMDSTAIDAFSANKTQGIVFASLGNGGYPKIVKGALLNLSAQGIPVVVSSRTGTGISVPDDVPLISADTLNPQKARVLLTVALTKTQDHETIRRIFGEY